MRRGMSASAAELSFLEKKVLLTLEKRKKATPEELRAAGKFRELVEVMNAASWLQAKGLVTMKERVVHTYRLARPDVARRPLAERKALKALIKAGGRLPVPKLKAACRFDDGELAVALGWLRRKGWAEVSKGPQGSVVILTGVGKEAADGKGPDEELLARLAKDELPEDAIDPRLLRDLKSRRELRPSGLLELRRLVPAAGPPGAGPARHVLSREALDGPSPGGTDCGSRREDARGRRGDREHGMAVPVGPQGGRAGRPPVPHDADHLAVARGASRSTAEGVHHRPQLPSRCDRLEASAGISPDRRRRDGRWREPRATDRHDRNVRSTARLLSREVPTRVLSLHGAEHGARRTDLGWEVDGARRDRRLPARGDGAARSEGARARLGPRPRTRDHGDRRDHRHPSAVSERPRLAPGPSCNRVIGATHPD